MAAQWMKRGFPILALLGFNLSGVGNPAQTYLDTLKKTFYFLRFQDFESISCQIKSPTLESIVNNLKYRFKSPDDVKVSSNLDVFRVAYSRNEATLSFTKPKVELTLLAEATPKNKNAFRIGNDQVKEAFDESVDAIAEVISSIMDEYKFPKEETIKMISFQGEASGFIVKYTNNSETAFAMVGNIQGSSSQRIFLTNCKKQ